MTLRSTDFLYRLTPGDFLDRLRDDAQERAEFVGLLRAAWTLLEGMIKLGHDDEGHATIRPIANSLRLAADILSATEPVEVVN